MALDYVALFILVFVFFVLFYGIIVIHDIPYEIAKKRNHPHQDAIHVSGWISLFTLHVIWPLLWVWAMLYRPDRGWGFQSGEDGSSLSPQQELQHLQQQVDELKQQLQQLQQAGQSSEKEA